jgi:hypothetical protein
MENISLVQLKLKKNLILTMESQKIALMSEMHPKIGGVNAA